MLSFTFEANKMMALPGNARFFLCRQSVNMHKSFEGLGIDIEKLFPGELLSGAFFIFLNRKRDSMKILFWDRDGFVIFYKRLERGSFSYKSMPEQLDRRTFLMLLEGVEPKRLQHRFCL